MDRSALNQPIVWVLLVLIVLLHISAFFLKKREKATLAAVIANFLLHMALVLVLLYNRAEPGELFLCMLISTAAGLFASKPSKKIEKESENSGI